MIRITVEIITYSWHDEALIGKLWQQIIKLFFIKHLVRAINKNYDRSVKEIFSEPTRRNPHTRVSSSIHLSPTTGGIKPWVLNCTQQDLSDRRKEKDFKDMQGYLACVFIAFVGSITKRASLYSIFINSRIGSLTNHSM